MIIKKERNNVLELKQPLFKKFFSVSFLQVYNDGVGFKLLKKEEEFKKEGCSSDDVFYGMSFFERKKYFLCCCSCCLKN